MSLYRKKPVEIEARQLPGSDAEPDRSHYMEALGIAEWCGGAIQEDAVDGLCLFIATREGEMKARPGDWIIKGVKGEFYPCDPEIFAATYDEVNG